MQFDSLIGDITKFCKVYIGLTVQTSIKIYHQLYYNSNGPVFGILAIIA